MSFRLIGAERAQHPISLLYGVIGVTGAGHYASRGRDPSRRELADRELKELIGSIFTGSLETYGAPRIQAELKDDYGVRVGRKRFARLMRELRIADVSRRRERRFRTTIPAREAPSAPDLVRWLYPSRGSRSPLGRRHHRRADLAGLPLPRLRHRRLEPQGGRLVMRDDLRAELVVDALGMALTRRKPKPRLVHHSDRGSQYTSLAFGKTMQQAGVLPSMGRRSYVFDNAIAESFFATLESKLLDRSEVVAGAPVTFLDRVDDLPEERMLES